MNPEIRTRAFPSLGGFVELWRFILKDRAAKVMLLLLIMCFTAIIEMATLASVVPLVGLLVGTQGDVETLISAYIPATLGNSENLHSYILVGVVIIVCLSAVLRILVLRLSSEFSAAMGLQLQTQYLKLMLSSEYEEIINESSSRKLSLITTKIPNVNSVFVLGSLNLATSLISAIGIVVMLIWLSTGVVLIALVVLSLAYVVIAFFSRQRLIHHGKNIAAYSPKSVQYVQDSLGGIRDVIMGSSQNVYVNLFANAAEKVEVGKARLVFYYGFPRPILEAMGIVSIAFITYFVNKDSSPDTSLLPVLGAFSLGLLRLLPYAQQIFSHWSEMYHALPTLDDVVESMNNFKPVNEKRLAQATYSNFSVPFHSDIELRNTDFIYKNGDEPVLADVNIKIRKGDYIGVVGPTGSGKSTLVDLIMGLLAPSRGALYVDGNVIDESNRYQWRNKIAHVPQRVYLADGTIEENIAFAVADDELDPERVRKSARRAHISDFIESLSDKYQAQVGENGVRLSGGQQQRIGIARALYAQCEVLVFDESTNALDKGTEKAIVDELLGSGPDITIIVIAHSLEAVKHCRTIAYVDKGRVEFRTIE